MNARLIKETRDLLPILASTLALIVVPSLIWPMLGFGYLALAVACFVMAGSSFGNEFQHRTISLLLSQPIARSVLWRDKMLVLGAGMLTSVAALLLCLAVRPSAISGQDWPMLAFVPLCAFCGAPFWTLTLRQGIAGMVVGVGAPSALLAAYALVTLLRNGNEPSDPGPALLVLLFIYCALVYWLGYAKFKRLEAVDAPARELSLPAGLEATLMRPFTKASSRFVGPFSNLLKKEFRLQQTSFLLAGIFVLVAVAGFCVSLRYRELASGIVGADLFVYMLILPLIAGAISIGEERGWAMAEWHLTLPPSARKQWWAKMLAAFSTSLGLGLLLPVAVFVAASPLFTNSGARANTLPIFEAALWVLSQMLVTSTAVYGASFSRNTLRGILAAFGILVAATTTLWLGIYVVHHSILAPIQWIGHPYVVASLMLPLLPVAMGLVLCLLQWLAWSNFRRSDLSVGRLLTQFVALFLAVWLNVWVFFTALFYLQRV